MFMYDWCYLFFISTIPVNKFFLILQIQYEFYFFFQIQDMYAADDLKKGLFSILIYTNFIT